MKEVYEIISRIDRALGDSMEKDFSAYGFAMGALWEAILSTGSWKMQRMLPWRMRSV